MTPSQLAMCDSTSDDLRTAGAESAWFLAIDAFVERIHRTGFVQSFILHVAILLVMALAVVVPDAPRVRPPVVLDFEAEPVAMTPPDDLALAEVEMPPAPWETADAEIPPAEVEVEAMEVATDVSVESLDPGALDAPAPLPLPDAADLLTELPVAPLGRPARNRAAAGPQRPDQRDLGSVKTCGQARATVAG